MDTHALALDTQHRLRSIVKQADARIARLDAQQRWARRLARDATA